MMSPSEVGPPPGSIRKGVKRHPIRRSHNDCQCCKVSKCSLADKARQTTVLVKSGHLQCKKTCPLYYRKRTFSRAIGMSAKGSGH